MTITIAQACTLVWNTMGTFLTYVFDFEGNPALATVALLPIVSVAIALVSKLIHHKHKV